MKKQIVASIGLISDTHFQDRLFSLPPNLPDLWSNIDLILHAGDVGELGMLDLLSKIAPVVAVHGNDEPEHVKDVLPYQQTLGIDGFRILLWHSHYRDPEEERAKRKGSWGPKLERIAARGGEVGAKIVIYGHTHVPMIYRLGDILLINPGALASGSYFTRHLVSSVGRMQILANGEVEVILYDIAAGQAREFQLANQEDDFSILADQYQEWMVEPDLVPDIRLLRSMNFENIRAIVHAFIPIHKRYLHRGTLLRKEMVEVIHSSHSITPDDKEKVLAVLSHEQKQDSGSK